MNIDAFEKREQALELSISVKPWEAVDVVPITD